MQKPTHRLDYKEAHREIDSQTVIGTARNIKHRNTQADRQIKRQTERKTNKTDRYVKREAG